MVYSLWFMVYGLWFMVYGLWFMVHGLWFMVYGLWFMVYGLWFTATGQLHATVCVVELPRRNLLPDVAWKQNELVQPRHGLLDDVVVEHRVVHGARKPALVQLVAALGVAPQVVYLKGKL
jgi:hypothetical protein